MKQLFLRAAAAKKLAKIYWRSHGGGLRGLALLTGRAVYFLTTRGPAGFVRRAAIYRSIALNQSSNATSVESQPTLPFTFTIQPHSESVDIIVCVHNALGDVKRCLSSILRYTFPPYRLIVVDDGSDPPTRDYLRRFAAGQGAELIHNDRARGYTRAANQGLRTSSGAFVLLLNSDTCVTSHWLDRLVMCAKSDPGIGMVGPLSNTASWQSIPEILVDGDWANNPLPSGVDVKTMSHLVAACSGRVYPRLGFLNGFCLLLKRELIVDIGIFDDVKFGAGFGEENDYCLRTQKAGWTLCVADDVYIHHAQSRSYSNERRLKLAKGADEALARKHGQETVSAHLISCRSDPVIEGVRARVKQMLPRRDSIQRGLSKWEGKRIVFLMPVAEPGGGANVIFSEARALAKMGVDVRFINHTRIRPFFEQAYPSLEFPLEYFDKPDQIPELCRCADAAVATLFTSVRWLKSLQPTERGGPVQGYYIQDFEPDFFRPGSDEQKEALASYTLLPALVRVTKTEWNRQKVSRKTGADAAVIGPSCDLDLFRPRQPRALRWPQRPLRIAAMIRPSTPRRAPKKTLRVLTKIHKRYGDNVEIVLFGVNPEDPAYQDLIGNRTWNNLGVLSSPDLAILFNDIDIFVDFSSFQAMGLTALEAMACGAAVIVPQAGGTGSFAEAEKNALVVDTENTAACETALRRLLDDPVLRHRLQNRALRDVVRFAPEYAAYRLMTALFPERGTQ